MGPAFRSMRTDRSAANQRVAKGTVRRVLSYARSMRRLIAVFLVFTVIDAGLVVVIPLLVKRILDDGILAGNSQLVTWLAVGDGRGVARRRGALGADRLLLVAHR